MSEAPKGRIRERAEQPNEVPVDEVVAQLARLGASAGDVLLVHASYRAVRPIEDGPAGLVCALTRAVGDTGTVVMPSWPADALTLFDPERTDAAEDLGIVARTFWRLPGVRRTTHVQAFAARGLHAERILSDPLPLPPHIPESPVGRVHELDGKVLLLGVNHDANTTIHLAEVIAGVPYGLPKVCTGLVDGEVVRIEYRENDHCCARFKLADEWLRGGGHQAEGRVGFADARLVRSRAVVSEVVSRLVDSPLFFLHDAATGCRECDDARASTTGMSNAVRRDSGHDSRTSAHA